MKYLGWANGWHGETPEEVKESKRLGHRTRMEKGLSPNTDVVICEEGGWYYNIDCS